jgi:hypothetical protein
MCVDKHKILLKSDKNNGYFAQQQLSIYDSNPLNSY